MTTWSVISLMNYRVKVSYKLQSLLTKYSNPHELINSPQPRSLVIIKRIFLKQNTPGKYRTLREKQKGDKSQKSGFKMEGIRDCAFRCYNLYYKNYTYVSSQNPKRKLYLKKVISMGKCRFLKMYGISPRIKKTISCNIQHNLKILAKNIMSIQVLSQEFYLSSHHVSFRDGRTLPKEHADASFPAGVAIVYRQQNLKEKKNSYVCHHPSPERPLM